MFEKVNPQHPDKVADRIAGAIVDLAYSVQEDPKIAVEVLIGHEKCSIIIESDVPNTHFDMLEIHKIVERVSGQAFEVDKIDLTLARQDKYLKKNQSKGFRCGDNGIFKGMPVTKEQEVLTNIADGLFEKIPYDGKYILDGGRLIICQSHAKKKEIAKLCPTAYINPLGDWTGGTDVDSGATNRKLGSDMGDSVTGGGLHGKDLSKADVSVNIYAFLKAQETGAPVELSCAIGDDLIDGRPYDEIVDIARDYIKKVGGFEKFAEWGLIRPEVDE